jgi:hypothetical protein
MKTIGLCTHFSQTDEWAFTYALRLARSHDWQLNICHWLNSPYSLRRDVIYPDLLEAGRAEPLTPALLTKLELQLRQYYDARLGDFEQAAFKLCEGLYQVELVRCFRQHLLDLVVMGYQTPSEQDVSSEQPLEDFALRTDYPLVIVGPQSPDQYLINPPAFQWLDDLLLPEGSWKLIEPIIMATV